MSAPVVMQCSAASARRDSQELNVKKVNHDRGGARIDKGRGQGVPENRVTKTVTVEQRVTGRQRCERSKPCKAVKRMGEGLVGCPHPPCEAFNVHWACQQHEVTRGDGVHCSDTNIIDR